ncbi:DNRLRE domain-containing protein [Paenibacillus thiaminolyticus]
MSTTDNTAGVFRLGTEELTAALQQSGYRTVFEIASEDLAEFQKNNPEIPSSDAKEIYQLAVQRTDNLCMLYKAWQLHNDPVVQSLPKLSADTGLQGMREALERSLGGGADWGDLFPERSPEGYAEASSIQSLFSPGRYLTMLYKIARQLHSPDDKLHIDNRRPDLKSLILNTVNMNREVSSLDILLDVLQPDGSGTLTSLKDKYYPMTLPYDDDLAQINAVAEARSSNLLGIWDTLLDTQRTSILQNSAAIRKINKPQQSAYANQKASDDEPVLITREEFYLETGGVADTTPSPPTREMLSLTPNSFRLLVNPEPTAEDIANHYNVKTAIARAPVDLAAALNVVDDFCLKTGLSFNELLDLTMQKDYESSGSEYKSRFVKFGGEANVPVSTYGAVFLTGTEETPMWVGKGAMISPAADAYVRNGTYADINYGSANGLVVKDDGSNGYVREAYIRFDLTGLSGAVEEAKISLTTIAKQLSSLSNQAQLVSDNSWDEMKITWNNKPAGGAIIASWDVAEVGENVQIDVTRQVKDALAHGQDKLSFVIRSSANYGSLGDSTYASREHPDKALRPSMEIKGAGLNFTADNVVALAGRAEKLVRLARSTGLSFEQLDWLIANASCAIIEHGGELILDRPVLGAVAEFTRLHKRYGITSDMFAAFIGEVNTYAEAGKDSFYQTIFSTADHSATLPLGASLQFEVKSDFEMDFISLEDGSLNADFIDYCTVIVGTTSYILKGKTCRGYP